jgi:hypothetical protein
MKLNLILIDSIDIQSAMGTESSKPLPFEQLTPAERKHFVETRQILYGTSVDEVRHNTLGAEMKPLVSSNVEGWLHRIHILGLVDQRGKHN